MERPRTRNNVGADIDDNSTRLEPRALHKLGLSDGSDDNVSLLDLYASVNVIFDLRGGRVTYDGFEVLSAAVTLSDGSVLAAQERAYRASDDVRTTEDDGILAGDVDARGLKEDHDAGRSARLKERLGSSRRKHPDVLRRKSIRIPHQLLRLEGKATKHAHRHPFRRRLPR
jgi:hypothetical protein